MRLRPVALPVEHGGWGLLLEPLVVGLGVAPARSSLLLGVAAVAAFLVRHPLRIVLGDRRHGRFTARTGWAVRFVVFYALLAGAAFGAALIDAAPGFWLPVCVATPLVLLQLRYDARGAGREIAAQLMGAFALTAIAPTLVLAAGWRPLAALVLWAILAARVLGSVLYVRARLRMVRGGRPRRWPTCAVHGAALALICIAAASRVAPWLAAVLFFLLAVRAVVGLFGAGPTRAKRVGWQEVAFAVLTAAMLVTGYRLGI